MKVGYYQGTRNDPAVLGLIAASPPAAGVGRVDSALLALADRMIAEGRGQDLLPWGSSRAGGGTWSASAYARRARLPGDVYGVELPDPAVANVTCPILAFYGTEEEWVGGAADLASYLLFDRDYAAALMDLGFEDARKQRDALVEFFRAPVDVVPETRTPVVGELTTASVA